VICEHEIPNGSKLYFGKTAKAKRLLEQKVSGFFDDIGFEQIITPNFSYSGHQSIDNIKELITISDSSNNQVALRADSTLDVVRIITKRLGRTTSHKKWFYIQPIFSYPSTEQYQIGCEWIEHENISDVINLNGEILKLLGVNSIIQLANIKIPKLVSEELNIDLELFKNGEIAKLFELNCDWLDKLLKVKTVKDLENIVNLVPQSIKDEILVLKDVATKCDYENIIISPLYYNAMKYYDGVYYKVFEGNFTIAKGGGYESDGVSSQGFALYVDNLLKILEGKA
jgi:histidyl-tRNA synthetase